MAKDPAFLFYPGDWTIGTIHLTILEKGCYLELLILQFAKGKFTEAHAKHMLNGSFDHAWPIIKEKFKTDGEFYWNERLYEEKEKRKKFTESRRSNGSKEKVGIKKEENHNKHMLKHMDKHMDKHMEDENNNTIIDNNNKVTDFEKSLKEDILKQKEDMIVKKMLDVWIKHNPRYQYEEINDYPAILNLAFKIGRTKNWTKEDVIKNKILECLVSWEKIVIFIKQDDFYKKLEIKTIDKMWAGLYQTMDAFIKKSNKIDDKDPTKVKIKIK